MTNRHPKASAAAADPLTRLRRLVHIAKRDLQLDDDTYRAALVTATGKRSSSDMSLAELERAVAHFKAKGFKVKVAKKAGTRAQAVYPQAGKIRALWLELHQLGAVRDSSEAALAHWIKRETGVDAIQWLEAAQASQAIEKLKRWRARL